MKIYHFALAAFILCTGQYIQSMDRDRRRQTSTQRPRHGRPAHVTLPPIVVLGVLYGPTSPVSPDRRPLNIPPSIYGKPIQ